MNRPVIHPYTSSENCPCFLKPSPKICGESIEQISLQLFSVKIEPLLATASEKSWKELCTHPLQLLVVKMGLGCRYTQTIQSFTPVNSNASSRSRMIQLDASKHPGQCGDIAWSVPAVCVCVLAEQTVYTLVCLCVITDKPNQKQRSLVS